MPFIVSRLTPAPTSRKATHASFAVNQTAAVTEPETARLPVRHRKKSSTTSIFKSSISRPKSSYPTQPSAESTAWQPKSSTEPPFERPRPSPVPPSPSEATQQCPSLPVRPTPYTSARRSTSPPTRSNQLPIPPSLPSPIQASQTSRPQSISSDQKESALSMVGETSVSIQGGRRNGQQTSPTSLGLSPSVPVVRQSIFKPSTPEERSKPMTAWERIGERRARERGCVL